MSIDLKDISQDAWEAAAARLRHSGVFADEERRFPGPFALRPNLDQFETELRAKGYHGGGLEIGDMDEPSEGIEYLIFDSGKFGSILSASAAWHQDRIERWHNIVTERVQDWLARLDDLRKTMASWLPNDMSIADRLPTTMHEYLMKRYDVPPAKMPTFDVVQGDHRVMRVQPKGLWIIGANGRVDLTTRTASYILVDESEPSSHESDWHYYASANRLNAMQFDKDRFLNMLH
jgi:hypothetical protein